MERIDGHHISILPISELKKVSDLLEYEGPILSHFEDLKGNNYLYYWVDYGEEHNRWLVWKVEDKQLYDYIKGTVSLKDILLSKNKDFIYSVDIDKDLNKDAVWAIEVENVSEIYIPEDNTYFSARVPLIYNELLLKYEKSAYLEILKENALYFKIEPNNPKYSSSVSIMNAGDFLTKLGNSFLGFVEVNFYDSFKEIIPDFESMKKTIEQFKEVLTPRIVEAEYGSFKVAISTDYLNRVESEKYLEWQKIILERYKNEVVDIDYNSDLVLQGIAKKYSNDARRKIFLPYINVLNDKDYNVEVTNYKKTFKRKYYKINSKQQQIIIPKIEIAAYEVEKKKLLSVVIEVDEKLEISNISNKNIQKGLLFSNEVKEVDFVIDSIITDLIKIKFKEPIHFSFRKENTFYHAENTNLGIIVDSKTKELLREDIEKEFIKVYAKASNDEVEKEKFDSLIDSIVTL